MFQKCDKNKYYKSVTKLLQKYYVAKVLHRNNSVTIRSLAFVLQLFPLCPRIHASELEAESWIFFSRTRASELEAGVLDVIHLKLPIDFLSLYAILLASGEG